MNYKTSRLCESVFRGLLQDLTALTGNSIQLPGSAYSESWMRLQYYWTRVVMTRDFVSGLGTLGKYLDGRLAKGECVHYDSLNWELYDDACLSNNRECHDFCHDVMLSLRFESDITTVRWIRQFCHLLAKLEIPHEKHTEEEAFLGLRSRNADLGSFWTADRRSGLRGRLGSARKLIFSLFKHYKTSRCAPSHGPGAVSTGEKGIDKMLFRYLDSASFPFYDWFYMSPSHLCDDGLIGSVPKMRNRCVLQSRVVAVPKDFRGPRIICAEPKEAQWLQQGIWSQISELTEAHGVVGECIDFYDQSKSGSMALAASADGRMDTIDLSEASDRIALDLVFLLFHKNGNADRFYRDYLACRTRRTRFPDGCITKLRMATTMGSALCFPLQSIVFLSLVYQAMVDRVPSTRMTSLVGRVRVFGDDIIVQHDDTNYVIDMLHSCGLKVNERKTCIGLHFKESCGIDAYRGINVSPVRLKTYVGSRVSGDQLLALCATQQRLHLAGYQIGARSLAAFIRSLDNRVPGVPARFSQIAPLSVICSDKYVDAPRRWVRSKKNDYQCWVYRCLIPVVRTTEIKNDSWSALMLTLSKATRRPAFLTRSRDAYSYRVAWLRIS